MNTRAKKSNLTVVAQRINLIQGCRTYAAQVLQYDELEYNNFIFELGCEYVESRVIPEQCLSVLRIPRYWKWFKNHFHKLEAEFIEDVRLIHVFTGRASKMNYEKHMRFILRDNDVENDFFNLVKRFQV